MSFAFEMVLRSSLVLAAGMSVSFLLKKQPAALRHWVLLATLVLAAAQPAMNRLIPALGIIVPGGNQVTVENAPDAQTEVTFDLPTSRSLATPAAPVDWVALVFPLWLGGVAISFAVLLIGAAWLTWLTARSSDAGVCWQLAAEDVRRRLGIRRPVRIAITQHPAMLVTWGVIAPVILLPRTAAGWPAERIQLVLAHEMAHLVRRDWLVQLAAEMLRAIHWFNPLFWIACARLRRESEYACDDVVLDLGVPGTSYAEHLVALARTFSVHGRTWLPAPSIAGPSTLERRVRAMLNPQVDRRPVSRSHKAALAALMFVAALPIAAASQGKAAPIGTITDPSGLPLPDAIVRLSAAQGDGTFEARTDATGAFQFSEIPAGEYMLSARYPGFSSVRQRIAISGAIRINMQLQVGTLRETISVRAGADGGGSTEPRKVVTAKGGAPSCGTTAVGGNLKAPMKLRDVRPRFKQAWVDANVEGDVLLQARIGKDGRITDVEVVSPSNPELEDEAIAAVSQWEFSPTYLNCEPIEVRMFVSVSFKLER